MAAAPLHSAAVPVLGGGLVEAGGSAAVAALDDDTGKDLRLCVLRVGAGLRAKVLTDLPCQVLIMQPANGVFPA